MSMVTAITTTRQDGLVCSGYPWGLSGDPACMMRGVVDCGSREGQISRPLLDLEMEVCCHFVSYRMGPFKGGRKDESAASGLKPGRVRYWEQGGPTGRSPEGSLTCLLRLF